MNLYLIEGYTGEDNYLSWFVTRNGFLTFSRKDDAMRYLKRLIGITDELNPEATTDDDTVQKLLNLDDSAVLEGDRIDYRVVSKRFNLQ